MLRFSGLMGTQAGKVIFVGALPADQVLMSLRAGHIQVNPNAQRSLAKGRDQETTKQLIESDKVLSMPRIKQFHSFMHRVMDRVEEGESDHGFLGALQCIVPEEYKDARVTTLELKPGDAIPTSLALVMSCLAKGLKFFGFEAQARLDQVVLRLGDGQARAIILHCLERSAKLNIVALERQIKKLDKPTRSEEDEGKLKALRQALAEAVRLLSRVNDFLATTTIPFVAYAKSVEADGSVVGLNEDCEKRLYIEANALNNTATTEEFIRFEVYSPVVLSLQELRLDPVNMWMTDDFIESKSKTVGVNNLRVFTLSAVLQAFAASILDGDDPISDVDDEMFQTVAEREPFVRAFWKKVSDVFGARWVLPGKSAGDRLKILQEEREKDCVLYQALLLVGLGRLGNRLGHLAGWNPESTEIERLEKLRPNQEGSVNYYPDQENRWRNAMMKPVTDKVTQQIINWSFNNVADSHTKTYEFLQSLVGLPPEPRKTKPKKGKKVQPEEEGELVAPPAQGS